MSFYSDLLFIYSPHQREESSIPDGRKEAAQHTTKNIKDALLNSNFDAILSLLIKSCIVMMFDTFFALLPSYLLTLCKRQTVPNFSILKFNEIQSVTLLRQNCPGGMLSSAS